VLKPLKPRATIPVDWTIKAFGCLWQADSRTQFQQRLLICARIPSIQLILCHLLQSCANCKCFYVPRFCYPSCHYSLVAASCRQALPIQLMGVVTKMFTKIFWSAVLSALPLMMCARSGGCSETTANCPWSERHCFAFSPHLL